MTRLWMFLAFAAALAFACVVALGTPSKASAQETIEAKVYFTDSEGVGYEGVPILYWRSGGWGTFGTTDASGLATKELPEGNYLLRVQFRRGALESGYVPLSASQSYTFETVKVNFLNTGTLKYSGYYVGWGVYQTPTSPGLELLPYTYMFSTQHDVGNPFPVTIGPEGFTGGVLRLTDSSGAGLEGGTSSYYQSAINGWQSVPGTTNANGHLVFTLPNDSGNLTIRMSYAGSLQDKIRTQLNADNFTFQTAKVNVHLNDADGNPIDTGQVSYYANGWKTFGTGQTSQGVVSQELLPSTLNSVAMVYNYSREQKNGIPIVAPETNIVFQTGRLTLNFSDDIKWYYNLSYPLFANGMEFLPGTQKFFLGGASSDCSVDILIASGDNLVKSAIVATLRNGNNQPIPGAIASAYAGSWQTIGTTDAQGRTCGALNGTLGNTAVKMSYAGTSQTINQHQPSNSYYNFTAALVTIELRDSTNALMDTGNASYYTGSWHSLDVTSGGKVVTAMLPGSYSFAMVYNGTRQQLNAQPVSGNTSVVTFKTTNVTVKLIDSAVDPLDTGSASYYAGSWRTIGNTSGGQVSVEMLPGSYAFAMVYEGTRQQLNAQPVSGPASTVTFQTSEVTVSLIDSAGDPILDPGSASYYAGSWRSIGDTSGGEVTVEMLPGNYAFAMVYKGTRQQLNAQPVSGLTSAVTFQTGTVTSGTGTATSYYAGGWKAFTNGMDLLPGTYTFAFSDSTSNTPVTITAGTEKSIH